MDDIRIPRDLSPASWPVHHPPRRASGTGSVNLLPFNRDGYPLKLGIGGVKQCRGYEHVVRRSFAEHCFEYILRGKGTLTVGGRTYALKTGDVMILPQGPGHEFLPDPHEPWAKTWFHCHGPFVDELLFVYHLKGVSHVPRCPVKDVFDRLLSPPARSGPSSLREVTLLLHELIARIADHVAQGPEVRLSEPTRRLKEFLGFNVERALTAEDMARVACKSVSQTIRLFKKETGVTPYDFHLRQKIDLARVLLKTPDHSIREISEQLGFSCPYYFSRLFKARTGLAPARFRSQALERR